VSYFERTHKMIDCLNLLINIKNFLNLKKIKGKILMNKKDFYSDRIF
jgi:hypothetical protein